MPNLASSNPLSYGYTNQFLLTNAMSTTAQLVKAGVGQLGVVVNTQGTAQANSISLYDSANISGISAANLIQTITLGASAAPIYNFPFENGLVIQANNGAVTGGVWVVYS